MVEMRGRPAGRSYRHAGRRPHLADGTNWWRWGELNPRPKPRNLYFYVRSFTIVLLDPGHSVKQPNRRAQPEFESRTALRRNCSARFLNDARVPREITGGLTDFGLATA